MLSPFFFFHVSDIFFFLVFFSSFLSRRFCTAVAVQIAVVIGENKQIGGKKTNTCTYFSSLCRYVSILNTLYISPVVYDYSAYIRAHRERERERERDAPAFLTPCVTSLLIRFLRCVWRYFTSCKKEEFFFFFLYVVVAIIFFLLVFPPYSTPLFFFFLS